MKELAIPLCLLLHYFGLVIWGRIQTGRWDFSP